MTKKHDPLDREMSAEELREILDRLGYSQRNFAQFVGVDERQVRRWAADNQRKRGVKRGVPGPTVTLLQIMDRLKLTKDDMVRYKLDVERVGPGS